MTPLYESEQSELISAMSAMNTHDTRKDYDGTFLSDEIQNVALAMESARSAFDLHEDDFFDDVYIMHCSTAIELLQDDFEGEKLTDTHYMLEHAVDHIQAAIKTYKAKHDME